MLIAVQCEECKREVACLDTQHADVTFVEEGHLAELLLLAMHASPPHQAPHTLNFTLDGKAAGTFAMGGAVVELEIECQAPECLRQGRSKYLYKNLPAYCVGAVAISFHSGHEGHPMCIRLDGKQIYSPK